MSSKIILSEEQSTPVLEQRKRVTMFSLSLVNNNNVINMMLHVAIVLVTIMLWMKLMLGGKWSKL